MEVCNEFALIPVERTEEVLLAAFYRDIPPPHQLTLSHLAHFVIEKVALNTRAYAIGLKNASSTFPRLLRTIQTMVPGTTVFTLIPFS